MPASESPSPVRCGTETKTSRWEILKDGNTSAAWWPKKKCVACWPPPPTLKSHRHIPVWREDRRETTDPRAQAIEHQWNREHEGKKTEACRRLTLMSNSQTTTAAHIKGT